MIGEWLSALVGLLPDWFWLGLVGWGFVATVIGVWNAIRKPIEYPPDVGTRDDREGKP